MGQVETLVHCGEDCLRGKNTSDSKVVLTNMKVIGNDKSEGLRPCPLTTPESPDKCGPPKSSSRLDLQTTPQIPRGMERFATSSGTPTMVLKCQVPRRAMYEAEDSAVALSQGANLPSVHQGSEKNFVLHSRDSSCDSGVLSASSSPAADHIQMLKGQDSLDAGHYASESKEPGELHTGHLAALQISALSFDGETDCQEEKHPEESSICSSQGECTQDKINEEGVSPSSFSALPAEEKSLRDCHRKNRLEELPGQGHPLRKYSTSDSLDEYMDACCRLSKVNEGNSKTYSSGLGYLEHICQLMEKIGQLQEQNLKLQKEISSLQKEQKTNQLKEEYLLQHCSCGAANFLLSSYQEARNSFPGWNSRPHSLLAQNGIMSDLSVIPETGGNKTKQK